MIDRDVRSWAGTPIPDGRYGLMSIRDTGVGTGLGLAAVYGIMEQDAGFVLNFPLVPTDPPTAVPNDQPAVASKAAPEGATILVIDDDPAVLTITGQILEAGGFRVQLATDGASALASVARAGPPDLVVTDLNMPGMGGAEVAKRLVADCPELPILFVSGYSSDDLRLELGIGSKRFLLQKPFTAQELLQKVARVLSREGDRQQPTRPS